MSVGEFTSFHRGADADHGAAGAGWSTSRDRCSRASQPRRAFFEVLDAPLEDRGGSFRLERARVKSNTATSNSSTRPRRIPCCTASASMRSPGRKLPSWVVRAAASHAGRIAAAFL